MNKILKRLRTMKPEDLCELSDAVNFELRQRAEAKKTGAVIDAAVEKLSPESQEGVLPIPVAARAPGPRRAA